MRRLPVLLLTLALMSVSAAAWGQISRSELRDLLRAPVPDWRFHPGEVDGAERADYDDSEWDLVTVRHIWWPNDSTCWFRTMITMPDKIHGLPTDGATVRLKLGVDNGAKAYVNGEFKQDFTWDNGDVVLTEDAKPGARITVALHCVNGPGFGALYKAELVSSRSETMDAALDDLLDQCDYTSDDFAFLPLSDVEHWQGRIDTAIGAVDMKAYYAEDVDGFLASAKNGVAALHADEDSFDGTIEKVSQRLANLDGRRASSSNLGWRDAYIESDLRVIRSFLQYAQDDLNDGDPRHAIRAVKIARYLDRLADETAEQLEATIQSKDPGAPVPRYHTGSFTIHDGDFWQDNRPVFFTGVGHFNQVRQDLPILNEYGLNIVQFEMGPSRGLPDPDTVDVQAIQDNVVHWLDVAAENNVAVNLLVSPHYFPQWAIDRNPELAECGYGFMKYCIDAPESRAVIEKWLRALMPLIKGHPALHSICLSNEPQYRGQCARSKTMFSDWLKHEYGSIEKLNNVYGTAYGEWLDVPMPTNRDNYALFFDWCRFNQDRFLEFHEFEKSIIHEYDPHLPVHAKVMSYAFRDPGQFENGINFEDFNQLGAIAGNDCSQMYNDEPSGEFAQEWTQTALDYTLQHCTAPNSPIFNSEDHIIVDGDWHYIPDGQIRTAIWTQALHGQGASTTWVWDRGQGGDLSENILTRPNCVRALGHVSLDLERLAPEMRALQQAPSEAAIFYSYSSLLSNQDYVTEAKSAFEGGYFADTVFDFITERQTVAGRLAKYKLLVIPKAMYAPESVVRAVEDYIHKGGVVLAVGDVFANDERSRPRADRLHPEGSGRLVTYPFPLSSRAYREILDTLLDEAGVRRPVRLKGEYDEPVWGVNVRATEFDGKLLVNLTNFTRNDRIVRLVGPDSGEGATNLLTNETVHFPLTMKPLEPVLLTIPVIGG